MRTAVALTALSFVPDLTFGFDAGSAATLITLHTGAAAIVVPRLARRLARADRGRTGSLSFRQDAAEPGATRASTRADQDAHERSTMSNEQVAPEMKDLAVDLLATVEGLVKDRNTVHWLENGGRLRRWRSRSTSSRTNRRSAAVSAGPQSSAEQRDRGTPSPPEPFRPGSRRLR